MIFRYRLTAGTQDDVQMVSLISIFVKLRGMMLLVCFSKYIYRSHHIRPRLLGEGGTTGMTLMCGVCIICYLLLINNHIIV